MSRPIHEILKEARLAAGIDLETVFEETFIPLKFLKSMENGEWENFPSRVHRDGFLKKYLAYLKLPEDIIAECTEFRKEPEKEEEKEVTGREFSLVPFVIVLMVVIFFVSAGIFLMRLSGRKSRNVQLPEKTSVQSVANEPVSITLKATEDVWLKVVSDGDRIMERVLKSGENFSVTGKEIAIKLGNAGGLLIEKNGKSYGPFGRSGQVMDLNINASTRLP